MNDGGGNSDRMGCGRESNRGSLFVSSEVSCGAVVGRVESGARTDCRRKAESMTDSRLNLEISELAWMVGEIDLATGDVGCGRCDDISEPLAASSMSSPSRQDVAPENTTRGTAAFMVLPTKGDQTEPAWRM